MLRVLVQSLERHPVGIGHGVESGEHVAGIDQVVVEVVIDASQYPLFVVWMRSGLGPPFRSHPAGRGHSARCHPPRKP